LSNAIASLSAGEADERREEAYDSMSCIERCNGKMCAYESIMEVLDSIPWECVPDVVPLRPVARIGLEFFPRNRGY